MQNHSTSSGLKPLVAACLLACASLGAQAATFNFSGVTDSGPNIGVAYSGSFSFADPAPFFNDSVDLDAFSLDFMGETYTLADADFTPLAWFGFGDFLGVDYFSSGPGRPEVALLAGFSDVSEALFSYTVNSATGGPQQGLGSLAFVAVPEPASLALALAGLALMGGLGARAKRS